MQIYIYTHTHTHTHRLTQRHNLHKMNLTLKYTNTQNLTLTNIRTAMCTCSSENKITCQVNSGRNKFTYQVNSCRKPGYIGL